MLEAERLRIQAPARGRGRSSDMLAKLRDVFWNDPLMALAIAAALFAMATTPIAFAVLGRMDWFKARRGRTLQTPDVRLDRRRDDAGHGHPGDLRAPWSSRAGTSTRTATSSTPTRPGRCSNRAAGTSDVKEADAAVKGEMERLAEERKNLVDNVKKLDEAMLALRAVAGTSPAVAQAIPNVLERWPRPQERRRRRPAAADGLHRPARRPGGRRRAAPAPTRRPGTLPAPAPAPRRAPPAAAWPRPRLAAELATVPEPQKPLAAMLPLTDIPAGWIVGKSGESTSRPSTPTTSTRRSTAAPRASSSTT